MFNDPIEKNPKYKAIIKKAEREAKEYIQQKGYCSVGMGACHVLWGEKKRILKEKYGVDWKTPAEMNPDTCFD